MGLMDLVKQEGVAKFALNIQAVPTPPEARGARPAPDSDGEGG